MSNTRKSKTGEYNQERYCSSPAFEIGLKANLVAKRCSVLSDKKECDFIFWLQAESHKPGGLTTLLHNIPNFKEPIHEKAKELWWRRNAYGFDIPWPSEEKCKEQIESYIPKATGKIIEAISNYCLDPEYQSKVNCERTPRDYETLTADLFQILRDIKKDRETTPDHSIHKTNVMAQVEEGLQYSRYAGLVLIEGVEQVGKSFAAERWCARNQGIARYVKVPAGSDDFNFFRAIAGAIGIASGVSMKGLQMRERIEYTLQTIKPLVCFDDAHNLWPQNNRKEALPNRLNWILNALVESGVPVVLIAGPEFTQDQKIIARKTLWRDERFKRVLAHYYKLPELSVDELIGIARIKFPELPEEHLVGMAGNAKLTKRYCKGIERIAARARFIANQAGREEVKPRDVSQAIDDISPADMAFQSATQDTVTARNRRAAHQAPRNVFSDSPLEEKARVASEDQEDAFPTRRGTESESLLKTDFKAV